MLPQCVVLLSLLLIQINSIDLHFNDTDAVQHVYDKYLSFNIDAGSLYHDLDFTDISLINIVKSLADAGPMQLRIGGTAADDVLYTGDSGLRGNCSVTSTEFIICVNNDMWDNINAFMKKTGARFVWDLNLKTRKHTNGWDFSNSETLLKYTEKKQFKIEAFQLGNEVEHFQQHFNFTLSGKVVGEDFKTLASLLKDKYPSLNVPIYGPDACCEVDGTFLTSFTATAKDIVTAITIHDYPIARGPKSTCLLSSFTNVTKFSALTDFLTTYKGYVNAGARGKYLPIILGEFASTSLGGCEGLSNRFAAGFVFMFALSTVGKSGIVQINRQDIVGWSFEDRPSIYALVGEPGWTNSRTYGFPTPHPDYFLALLWKQLIGNTVLPSYHAPSDTVDVHLWCSSNRHGTATDAPVLTYINSGNVTESVKIPGIKHFGRRVQYFVTSCPNADTVDLHSDVSYLNGVKFVLNDDGTLPVFPFRGHLLQDHVTELQLPPYSYGFVVLASSSHFLSCSTTL